MRHSVTAEPGGWGALPLPLERTVAPQPKLHHSTLYHVYFTDVQLYSVKPHSLGLGRVSA